MQVHARPRMCWNIIENRHKPLVATKKNAKKRLSTRAGIVAVYEIYDDISKDSARREFHMPYRRYLRIKICTHIHILYMREDATDMNNNSFIYIRIIT